MCKLRGLILDNAEHTINSGPVCWCTVMLIYVRVFVSWDSRRLYGLFSLCLLMPVASWTLLASVNRWQPSVTELFCVWMFLLLLQHVCTITACLIYSRLKTNLFFDCTNYCWDWEVKPSLSDTSIVYITSKQPSAGRLRVRSRFKLICWSSYSVGTKSNRDVWSRCIQRSGTAGTVFLGTHVT